MLEQSIYTHIFHRDGHYYLYNSKNSLFAEITEDLYEILYNRDYQSLPNEVLENLQNRGVICDGTEQYLYYSEEFVKFNSGVYNNKELGLVVVPTTNCNFDCPYCFEGKKKALVMNNEIQNFIVKHLETNDEAKDIHLTWYGGEPLMAFDVIRSLYDKIKAIKNKSIKTHTLITNGYLIDDDVLDFINYAQINEIQITLDGVKSRHDKLRCLRGSGKPTFDRIITNIGNILTQCPNVKLSLRVNINRGNYGDFYDIFVFLHDKFQSDKLLVYPGFIREDTADKCSLCYNSMPNDMMC